MTSLSDKLKVDRDFDIYYFTDADVRAAVKELKDAVLAFPIFQFTSRQEDKKAMLNKIDEIFGSRLTQ